MALLDFQTSLARLVRVSNGGDPSPGVSLTPGERRYLSDLAGNPAFCFTVKVQRSWCAGRAAKAAYLTLSILPSETRDQLLEEWVGSGGGTHSFVGAESEAFLEFIARSLPDPSHELTICRMELAALRSSEGSIRFQRPQLSRIDRTDCLLRRGHYAGVVHFYAEPERVLNALLKRDPCPAISSDVTTLIFGPGLDRLYMRASWSERALYDRLRSYVSTADLFTEGFTRETIERLLEGGVLEYAE
ncbi:MAG: hypothetical protein LAP61_00395 [Acidobacteriia bacterium]|nr:hypothetical protein [Terriglobia bacterium]